MVQDIDGNTYNSVKIGRQEWTIENLNVAHYRNGDPIPEVQDSEEWQKLKTGAWCYYDNKPEKGKIYGKLYNWYAVNDPRGLAPEGWHIPSDSEWTELTDYLDDFLDEEYNVIKSYNGDKLKSKYGWKNDKNGSDASGFTGLPGGQRDFKDGFLNILENSFFYTSSDFKFRFTWYHFLSWDLDSVDRDLCNKADGLSVRCVKD